MQEQARGIGGHGRDVNDALGNLGAVRRGLRPSWSTSSTARRARCEPDREHRRGVRGADRARRPAALADRELQPRVPGHRARDEQLKETFIALPTFERESAQTLERLAEFARTTDPLVTQLRPAARELSPTLQDLGALAPDLEAFFRELGPLITASRDGFPAAEQVLEDARPLIAQLDPTMRQLDADRRLPRALQERDDRVPRQYAGRHPGRSTPAGHYLRTTNPLNPENLAVYPRRIGTNRPNAYTKPGIFRQLTGLAGVREPALRRRRAEHHQRLAPAAAADPGRTWSRRSCWTGSCSSRSPARRGQRPGAAVPAPGPYNFGGEITQYPHVRAERGTLQGVPLRVSPGGETRG